MRIQNSTKKEISIPLFVPVLIIIIFISIFMNITNLNSTVIARTSEEIVENNSLNKLETTEIAETTEVIELEQTEEEIYTIPETEVVEEVTEPTTSNETQNTTAKTTTCIVDGEQYSVVGILNIPSLNIEYPILSETTTKLLKVSLTKYWGVIRMKLEIW